MVQLNKIHCAKLYLQTVEIPGHFQYHKLKIYEVQLDDHYFAVLRREFIELNYQGVEQFQRRADHLTALVDLLIPYLVFKGYSIASISEGLRGWLIKRYRPSAKRIFDFFTFSERELHFLHFLGVPDDENRRFVSLMEKTLGVAVLQRTAVQISDTFANETGIDEKSTFAVYSLKVLDPHNHVRNFYDNLLKHVVHKRERQDLSQFNHFFDASFWSHSAINRFQNVHEVQLGGDPINISSRGKTLRSTLVKCGPNYGYTFRDDEDIPELKNATLRNAVYYYNLALGSKSIENSLSLLWTTLESIIPYRTFASDIECIQHILSVGLSMGAVSRDIHGFAVRFIQQNQQNANRLDDLGTRPFASVYESKGIEEWFNWVIDATNATSRFPVIKDCSELLAHTYATIGSSYQNNGGRFIRGRLEQSEASIKYQLQRIYLHRNQIVHSGDLVNEYSNLWLHLEWYVGKLLAYFAIELHFRNHHATLESAFRELEADHDYLTSYLKLNNGNGVISSTRVRSILFANPWQSF